MGVCLAILVKFPKVIKFYLHRFHDFLKGQICGLHNKGHFLHVMNLICVADTKLTELSIDLFSRYKHDSFYRF